MKSFDHKTIESKWQDKWERDKLYETPDSVPGKENEFLLVEYPYPSGNLHIGHWYAFAVPDIYARFRRMQGKNVLFPIGFDSFGLPAENAAIKRGLDPREWTYDNIAHMEDQLKSMGNSFDWSRKVVASDPEYYKWTQWLFLKLYEKGLAYKKDGTVPWCDSCKTVLANEQIVNGACERCGTAVVQKELAQWYLKITDYAERLLTDLDTLDWPEEIKAAQREWIGRSEGALLRFQVAGSRFQGDVEVFTTRADTLYGATYLVLAPEHPLLRQDYEGQALWQCIENKDEVTAYIEATKKKKELERKEGKEKSGVELKGVKAINPGTKEEIPIWIADYVLASYGTGAIMAVPAHDERDNEFAKKYELPSKQVIRRVFGAPSSDSISRVAAGAVVYDPKTDKYLVQYSQEFKEHGFIFGGVENGETYIDAAIRETLEETGYHTKFVRYLTDESEAYFYHPGKKENRRLISRRVLLELLNEQPEVVSPDELAKGVPVWLTKDELFKKLLEPAEAWGVEAIFSPSIYSGYGILCNSCEYDGSTSEEAKKKITEHVGGTLTTQYRLRDWLLSRQRYWGCPIPVVYDPEGKPHAVPEEHLPWTLPTDVDFQPTGEAPLAKSKELRERTERIFGPGWKPEVDTMDTFVDSSWYFLRYLDPKNNAEFCTVEKQKQWMPVARYSGGAEHTTMHLLYSRFFHKALYDLELVTESEPYRVRMNRGLILGPDGAKMSKSKGNVIDPDENVERVGADTIKMYLAFIGPYNEPGQYPWDLGGIAGLRRFLERVWNLKARVTSGRVGEYANASDSILDTRTSLLLNQTIKKVGDDIEALKFNTAISALMVLVNALEKLPSVPSSSYSTLIQLLAPFAPHLSEELWEGLGHKTSVHTEPWPEYDAALLARAEVTIAVQIDGKTRGTFTAAPGTSKDDLVALAKGERGIATRLHGREVLRAIAVPDRLVSFVTKPSNAAENADR